LWVDTKPINYNLNFVNNTSPRDNTSRGSLSITLHKPLALMLAHSPPLSLIPFVIYITPYAVASSNIRNIYPSLSLVA
jgi:hypothetical protein